MSLRSVRRRFAALRAVPSQVSADFAAFIESEIQAGHDAGTDPDREPWAELAPYTLAKGRTPPPLDDKGTMRGSFRAIPTSGAGVRLEYSDKKSGYAQDGAPDRPVRIVLPDTMPAHWKAELESIVRNRIRGT